MTSRFIILIAFFTAVACECGPVRLVLAQDETSVESGAAEDLFFPADVDRFVMPTSVEPPAFDPSKEASYLDSLEYSPESDPIEQTSMKRVDDFVGTSGGVEPITAPAALPTFATHPTEILPADGAEYDSPPQTVYTGEVTPDVIFDASHVWTWQALPDGLLYKSYMAGTRESRVSGALLYDRSDGWLLDATLGGRRGIFRYGTPGATNPNGWQLDIEGAAFVRLNIEQEWDVDGADFRFGIPLTYRNGPWQWKTGYYHLSAHVGDEFLERNPGFRRINYVRDALFFGLGYYICEDVRLYGEVGYAFHTDGGAKPLEFQAGADYSPAIDDGFRGAPFAAVNMHLREEVDYGGGVNVMAGWRWKGAISGSTIRVGLQYYNGKSRQYSFFNQHEELVGVGLWYDY